VRDRLNGSNSEQSYKRLATSTHHWVQALNLANFFETFNSSTKLYP